MQEEIDITDLENSAVLPELLPYVEELAPEDVQIVQELIEGKKADVGKIQRLISTLHDRVAAAYDSQGRLQNERFRTLEDLLNELGTQL